MRELFPKPDEAVDEWQRYRADERPGSSERPWILLDMITSVDGATTAGERSGSLSGPADKSVFMALRAIADVILVGAGTLHKENYGPPALPRQERARRRALGQSEVPRLAVVSGALSIGPDERAFREAADRPWVVTTRSSDPGRRAAIEGVADVLTAGRDELDLADAVRQLGAAGAKVILCEGGPTLNAGLLAANLVDEICWSIAPMVVGGRSHRLADGSTPEIPVGLELRRVLEQDGYLFVRYTRA